MNILKMAREGLRPELDHRPAQSGGAQSAGPPPGVRVKTNGDFTIVNLTVQPVSAVRIRDGGAKLFLVIFEDAPGGQPRSASRKRPRLRMPAETATSTADARDRDAEAGTAGQGGIPPDHQRGTGRPPTRSSSPPTRRCSPSNEELQSTNEELETSKEELQSVNEELATVNAELQNKVADLSRSNNDMNNLLAGTGIGTIFVDHQLRIQRFTPAVTQVINLILTDVGRPVGDIVSNLVGYDRLVADVRAVLDSLVPKEVEVQIAYGRVVPAAHPPLSHAGKCHRRAR